MKKTIIIAEAGVNHNGSMSTAKQLIDIAKQAGADFVKFQLFVPELLVSAHAPKAEYQKQTTDAEESQLHMIQKLALTFEQHIELMQYCNQVQIDYLCTPFDISSIQFLHSQGISLWKIPSGELTNFPYLREIARTKKPVIMSTGMATIAEIAHAIQVLTEYGTLLSDITLLHCTTEYPAPLCEVNLLAMQTLHKEFGVKVGFSDHTQGISVALAAVALGARVIEKHFTISKTMQGPDHEASLEPHELQQLVKEIRSVECAMGTGIKVPSASELKNIPVARKSIVAACYIPQGAIFTEQNIACKRPGVGLSPMKWNEVLGKEAMRDFLPDELIEL